MRKITVRQVLSPGSLVADDGQTYVLRGVPDVEEGFRTFAAAKALVERELLNRDLYVVDGTSRELPDLPGLDVEPLDASGHSLVPGLAARIAGALSGYPMK